MAEYWMTECMEFGKRVEIPDEWIASGKDAFDYVVKMQNEGNRDYEFDWENCYDSYGIEIREIEG